MLRRIVVAGLGIEAIYLFAALGPLSLLAHGTEVVDLGQLTGTTVIAAVGVAVVLLALFGLYSLAALGKPAGDGRSLRVAIAFTILFSATMVFVYPATAIDVYNYAVEGHVAAFDRINPLVQAPRDASYDPFVAHGGMWSDSPSPYGPIWIFLSKLVALAAGPDVVLAVVLLKGLAALSVVGTTLLLIHALRDRPVETRLAAATLFGWNPLVQIDLVANAHNDAVITLLIVGGLLLVAKRLPALGAFAIGAALLIKVLPIGIVPLYLVAVLVDRKAPIGRRLIGAVTIVAVLVGLAVVAYAPYWVGPQTIRRLLIADGDYLASLPSLVVFVIPSARDWLVFPRVALAAFIGLRQARGLYFGQLSLPAAAFEVLFATIVLAAHFAGWYLPLLLALAVLSTNQLKLRRVLVFTLSATLVTPLWAYAYTLNVDWMNAESFHFIVVPLTFIPPLLVTFPSSLRLMRSLTQLGQERWRALVPAWAPRTYY